MLERSLGLGPAQSVSARPSRGTQARLGGRGPRRWEPRDPGPLRPTSRFWRQHREALYDDKHLRVSLIWNTLNILRRLTNVIFMKNIRGKYYDGSSLSYR